MEGQSVRRAGWRLWPLAVAVNAAAVVAGVLAFLLWQHFKPVPATTRLEGTIIDGGIDRPTDDVGYISDANMRVTARRMVGNRALYDVIYTIGPDQLRVVPPAVNGSGAAPTSCLLLFGDSFTFGEGVNDDETYAAQVVSQSGGRVAAHAFGLSGWGPHQMLAGLQSGRFPRAITCRPTDAVYLFIPDHIRRVAGRAPWDVHGPRFRLGPDGRPVRDGNFDSGGAPLPVPDLDEGLLGWRRLVGIRALGSPEEVQLTAALIIESARELKRLYPGIVFHVFDWDADDTVRSADVMHRLAAAGLVLHPLEAIIPDYVEHLDRYLIDPVLDGHPNPAAHKLIAAYILHEIVGKRP